MPDFDTIRPGDIDNFVFDFTKEIGDVGEIFEAIWSCTVSPGSILNDPTPTDRLMGVPINSATQTTQQVGMMLEGVTYTLSAVVTLTDQRILSASGEVECTLIPPVTTPELTVARFRKDVPAFADASDYPNDSVQFWIDIVLNDGLFSPTRWGPQQLMAQEFYVAHELTLDRNTMTSAPKGGIGGGLGSSIGIATSKSVGGVSVSYDNNMGYDPAMGYLAYTMYGRRLYYYMQQAGAGPIQF
jgi:hypothetical protein